MTASNPGLRYGLAGLALLAACTTPVRAQVELPPDDTTGAVSPPPRAGLLPVPLPDLSPLEADVREQVEMLQDRLASVVRDTGATAARLGEAYGMMGEGYHAFALYPSARASYENARRLVPDDFRWAYLLADVLRRTGDATAAVPYYEKALHLRPGDVPALYHLADLHLQQNDLDAARAGFEEALRHDPGCAACRYGLGQVALSERDYERAARAFEQALADVPAASSIHHALAMAYRGLGDLDRARAALERSGPVGIRVADPLVDALQEHVRGTRLPIQRGRAAFGAGRFAEAAAAFREAVAADPESVPARVNLGSALAQLGDVTGAVEQYREVLRLAPDNTAAHYNMAFLLVQHGAPGAAAGHLEAVLARVPDDVEARLLLGRALLASGRREAALAALTQVAEARPDDEDVLLDVINLLVALERYGEARERLETAHARSPKAGRTMAALAYLLATAPSERDAARALSLARQVYQATGLPAHGTLVALALAALDRCDEAATWQRRMIDDARSAGDAALAARLSAALETYETDRPCRPDAPVSRLD